MRAAGEDRGRRPLLSFFHLLFFLLSSGTRATGGGSFSFSSSHRLPLLSIPTLLTRIEKTYGTSGFSSQTAFTKTSLGFGGVLAPLNRTRSGPKGVEAHLRPKPKESSKKKTNTHTHELRGHLGPKAKAQ